MIDFKEDCSCVYCAWTRRVRDWNLDDANVVAAMCAINAVCLERKLLMSIKESGDVEQAKIFAQATIDRLDSGGTRQ